MGDGRETGTAGAIEIKMKCQKASKVKMLQYILL